MRQKRGLTQAELAKLAGLEQSQISQLERFEDPNPGWHLVRRLSRVLKVPAEELFPMRSAGFSR